MTFTMKYLIDNKWICFAQQIYKETGCFPNQKGITSIHKYIELLILKEKRHMHNAHIFQKRK